MWNKFFGTVGFGRSQPAQAPADAVERDDVVKILKKGSAMRVIFFYPGEEGTYVDNANVTLYENGIVYIKSNQEETTTHLQNCEILWQFELDNAENGASKVRLLKPKSASSNESRASAAGKSVVGESAHGQRGKMCGYSRSRGANASSNAGPKSQNSATTRNSAANGSTTSPIARPDSWKAP